MITPPPPGNSCSISKEKRSELKIQRDFMNKNMCRPAHFKILLERVNKLHLYPSQYVTKMCGCRSIKGKL